MIPSLFPANYIDTYQYSGNYPTNFPPHGDVDLVDCLECFAEENEDEGSEWELTLTYPVGGIGYDQLAINKLILAKANDHQDPQFFRIYAIEKQIGKNVSVKAQHLSYDMANVPVKPFKLAAGSASNPSTAVSRLKTNAILSTKFYITTNITNSDKFETDTPVSMRAMLLDGDNSIKGTYGGDLVVDNCYIQLKSVGGADRGVVINYGIDLIDVDQEDNISEMVTGILPYYKRSTTDSSYESDPIIYGDVVYGPGTYVIQKINPVDLSAFFPNSVPTKNQITAKGREWVAKEEIGIPEVSLTVTYANLGQDVRIHDAVEVIFDSLGVRHKAKVVKYKYNVLLERCEEIEVGHAKESKLFNLMDASKLRKGLVPPERIRNESITDSKIAKGGIGRGKIGAEAIGSQEIQLHSIDYERLSRKQDPGGAAVTQDVVADNAIDTNQMALGAVTGAILATGAVTSGKIGNGAVTESKLGNGAVTEDKIGDEAVSTYKLGSGAVTSGKLASNSVSTSKVVNKAIAMAKLSADLQADVGSIDTLASQIAYINKLFASSAQIEWIYAQHIECTSSSIWVGGEAYSKSKIVTPTAIWYALAHA